MAEVTMPRLSDTMSEGTVGRWLKKPGDAVADGEIIAEIETDKATMELQAFESGTLQKILVPEGQTVPIGQTIAIIGDGAAPEEAVAPPEQPVRTVAAKSCRACCTRCHDRGTVSGCPAAAAGQSNGQTGAERIKASPLARRMADERGIDLRQVQGTGPGGRIIKENIESFQPSSCAGCHDRPLQPQPRPSELRRRRPTPRPSRLVACGARSPVR